MVTVNTASLRSEFDALKARFETLCADGAMSAESRALFEALLMRLHDALADLGGRRHPNRPQRHRRHNDQAEEGG